MGDIGHGKSNLITALLDDKDVVKEASSSESVTRVVFEYEYYADDDFRYSATVRLFPWSRVKETITYCFRHLMNGVTRPEGANESVEVDQKLSTTQELFAALFPAGCPLYDGQVLQFQDKSCLMDGIRQNDKSPSRRDLYADVLAWALEQYEKAEHAAMTSVNVRTCNELWEKIVPFTYGKGNGNSLIDHNPWPFVELVRIGGPFPITKHNTRIADTPAGLNDINQLNRDRTEQYLPRCPVTIIVNQTDRILSSIGIRRHLLNVKTRARPNHKMLLVTTRSETAEFNDHAGQLSSESEEMNFLLDEEEDIAVELDRAESSSESALMSEI
ncbi:hypothetical protein EK21DRAFT_110098 [Setomelanomma holmii]|uniref:Uncharacterized protein n=1 Tax=Setomelanomma holmii TaxID=210430 RepID=A0A9P4HCE4_9PLEO|nr:hypothetical protein EK21DRAFT_110098 [Setomelanomma holmii]